MQIFPTHPQEDENYFESARQIISGPPSQVGRFRTEEHFGNRHGAHGFPSLLETGPLSSEDQGFVPVRSQ